MTSPHDTHGPAAPPLFSVVVPVWRHWHLVPELLACLAAQSLAQTRFEVVLVNNEAPTSPPPLDLPANTRLVDCAAPGSYAARNQGAALARGRWLAFTDADCRPHSGWLAAYSAAARPGGLMAGPVEMSPPDPASRAAIYDHVRGIPQARYVARGYGATANLAVPAEAFRALGGFDAARRSGGDAEFCRRAGRAGHPIAFVAAAAVAHPPRSDWAEIAAKARRLKGGQIAAGSPGRRLAWTLRTLAPPIDEIARLAASPHRPRWRALAIATRCRLWAVEIAEAGRLALGKPPER